MRKVLTQEQIFRYIPKKHIDKFNPNYFDVDFGYDKPLYFILLKDDYEIRPDYTSGISFFTINELKDTFNRIYKIKN